MRFRGGKTCPIEAGILRIRRLAQAFREKWERATKDTHVPLQHWVGLYNIRVDAGYSQAKWVSLSSRVASSARDPKEGKLGPIDLRGAASRFDAVGGNFPPDYQNLG